MQLNRPDWPRAPLSGLAAHAHNGPAAVGPCLELPVASVMRRNLRFPQDHVPDPGTSARQPNTLTAQGPQLTKPSIRERPARHP